MVNNTGNDERVAAIVSKALRQPPAKRESYLRLVCSGDQELYRETASAVMWEERMGSFLLQPAIAMREFPRPFQPGQVISERFEILLVFTASYRQSWKMRSKCVTRTSAW
jgi:hypothetical protein